MHKVAKTLHKNTRELEEMHPLDGVFKDIEDYRANKWSKMVYLETHETISHYPQNHKIAQEQIKNTRLDLKETKRDYQIKDTRPSLEKTKGDYHKSQKKKHQK